jgi:hypothetical protein
MMDRRPPNEARGPRPWERRDQPPRSFGRSSEPRGGEEQPSNYEPIILPGESLAKYRDRPTAAPPQPEAAPALEPETAAIPVPEAPPAEPFVESEPESEPEVAEEFPINLQPDAPTQEEAPPLSMGAEEAEASDEEPEEEEAEALEETGLEAPAETELEADASEEGEEEPAQPVEASAENGAEGGPRWPKWNKFAATRNRASYRRP